MIRKYSNPILALAMLVFLVITISGNSAKAAEPQISVLANELIYNYGFDQDPSKFIKGDLLKVKGITKRWLVLTNFHGTTALNMQNSYVPGTRTLSWGNPIEYARYLFNNLSDSHNYSALLQDWGVKPDVDAKNHHNYRDHITFMLIPPQKEIEFLIGFAAPQGDTNTRDERAGGGVQLRLKNLPIGTVLIQSSLIFQPSKSKNGTKADKRFDFEATYNSAMAALDSYLDTPEARGLSIPQNVFMPSHKIYSATEEFFDREGLTPEEIKYSIESIKKFDVRRYTQDKFQITNIEEINN